jgi:hypothetical protein
MSRSLRAVSLLLMLLPILALPQLAAAKGRQAFRIVQPSGQVDWVRGATAAVWWHDYFSAGGTTKRGCSCTSPTAAARYAQHVARRWKSWLKPMLLVPTTGASMLYYPPTQTTPGYVLTPAVLGTSKSRWDDWEIASARMTTIIRNAVPAS